MDLTTEQRRILHEYDEWCGRFEIHPATFGHTDRPIEPQVHVEVNAVVEKYLDENPDKKQYAELIRSQANRRTVPYVMNADKWPHE